MKIEFDNIQIEDRALIVKKENYLFITEKNGIITIDKLPFDENYFTFLKKVETEKVNINNIVDIYNCSIYI